MRLLLFSCIGLLVCANCQAQDVALNANAEIKIALTVRVVSAVKGSLANLQFDAGVKDVAAQLRRLPFSEFRLMSETHQDVALKQKQIIPLSRGQMLAVRPLQYENERVTIWLKWCDNDGSEILDTKMRLEPGRSMLAGTESSDDGSSGMILVIDVNAKQGDVQ